MTSGLGSEILKDILSGCSRLFVGTLCLGNNLVISRFLKRLISPFTEQLLFPITGFEEIIQKKKDIYIKIFIVTHLGRKCGSFCSIYFLPHGSLFLTYPQVLECLGTEKLAGSVKCLCYKA